MRGVAMKTILAAVIASSSLLVAVEASARDYDRWDRWERKHHKHYKHHWKHSRGYGPPSRVIIERPVYVEPVRPVYVAPMMPAYGYGGGYQQDPSVNFNFSFPMR